MTTTAHTLSEQVYLAFHDWRARLDTDLDRLSDDYLLSLHTDIQRTLTQIGYEIDARRASHSLDPENIGICQSVSVGSSWS